MSNKDKYVGFRISEDTYEEIRLQAEREEITVSDFVRKSVQQCLSGVKQNEKHESHIVEQQLEKKDEQIEHLHQLLAIAQSNLQREQKALEDFKSRSLPWWKKIFGMRPKKEERKEQMAAANA